MSRLTNVHRLVYIVMIVGYTGRMDVDVLVANNFTCMFQLSVSNHAFNASYRGCSGQFDEWCKNTRKKRCLHA